MRLVSGAVGTLASSHDILYVPRCNASSKQSLPCLKSAKSVIEQMSKYTLHVLFRLHMFIIICLLRNKTVVHGCTATATA